MQKYFPLIAIYDAHSELEHFSNPELVVRAHSASDALIKTKLGVVGTVGSPIISTILSKVSDMGHRVVGLSPAGSEYEHSKAFRLPQVSFPLLYTGRGALGADVMALSSSHAVFIVGADEESLLGLLGCMSDTDMPIAIFTDRNTNDVREIANKKYPNLMRNLFVSNDAEKLCYEIANGIRKQNFN